MSEPYLIGIDPSLKGIGLAVLHKGKIVHYAGWTNKKGLQKKNYGGCAFVPLR